MSIVKKIFLSSSLVLLVLSLAGVAFASAVVLEVDADTPVLERNATHPIVVRALLKPGITPRDGSRSPLAVAVVLDKSGSMASDRKMENARTGALEALGILGARDIATVVVYDNDARVLVRPTSAQNFTVFEDAIGSVRAGGNTALHDGTTLGAEALKPFVREGYVPRIVLLSDGQANVGPSSTGELRRLGRRLAASEMTITTIGLGLDYNEDLMTALAAESGGNAYFARDAAALSGIFARDMEDAVALSARHVKLTLVCGARTSPVRVIGRDGETRGNHIEVNVGNLYGAEKFALFEVEIPETAREDEIEAATVRLEYVDPASGKTIAREQPLRLAFTSDARAVEARRNAEIVAQTELARNAEVRDEVVRLADEGKAQEASALLKQRAQNMISSYAPGAAPAPLQAEAEEIEALAEDIDASGGMSNERRKETVNKSYVEKNQQSDEKKK